MPQKTALYLAHLDCAAKVVDFHGWDLPLHYGSQLQEHHAVRSDAGMFDVSHMTIIDLRGRSAKPYLQYLLANDVARLTESGKALYSCMLNEQGGVIDDLIVYYINDEYYRLVTNSATRSKDLEWLIKQSENFDVQIQPQDQLAMIAVQGPHALDKLRQVLTTQVASLDLPIFYGSFYDDWFIAHTGYTGEAGVEIMLPASEAREFWHSLLKVGIAPCGLGARDTLRLEAGMNLYGQDMDETVTPLVSGLAWTIAWQPEDRNFIGRAALEAQRADPPQKFIGLILQGPGIIRQGYKVFTDAGEGIVTSGGFSPTLGKSIAFARVPAAAKTDFALEIRDKKISASAVKLPFVRFGQPVIGAIN